MPEIADIDKQIFADPGSQPLVADPAPGGNAVYNSTSKGELTASNAALYGLAGLGAGFIDTIGRSTRIWGDNDVVQTLQKYGPGGFGDFYARNMEGLRAGADIIGVGLAGFGAIKALNGLSYLRDAGKLGPLLKNSTALDYLLGSAAQMTARENAISAIAKQSAENFGVLSGRTFNNPALNAARRSYSAAKMMNAARDAAAFEIGVRTLYNASPTIFPADSTTMDQLRWVGAGVGASVGIEWAVGRYAAQQLIAAATKGVETYAGEFGKILPTVVVRPAERGPAMAAFARTWQLGQDAQVALADQVLKTNALQDMSKLDQNFKTQLQNSGNDTHLFIGKTTFDNDQLELVAQKAYKNPTLTLFMQKAGQVPKNVPDFYTNINKEIAKTRADLDDLHREIIITPKEEHGTDFAKKYTEAAALSDELKRKQAAAEEWHAVVESTGDISLLKDRPVNWLDTHSFADVDKGREIFYAPEMVAGKKVDNPHLKFNIGNLSLDDRFVRQGPVNPTPEQWSQYYAIGARMLDKDFKFKPAAGQQFVITDGLPSFQLDALINLYKSREDLQSNFVFSGAFQNIKDAEFHLADLKYRGFLTDMEQTEALAPDAPAIVRNRTLTPQQAIQKWNLPISDGLMPHPLLQVFQQAKLQGDKTLADMFVRKSGLIPQADHPLDLLQAAMRETMDVTDPTRVFATTGNLFHQRDIRPVMMSSSKVPSLAHTDATILAMNNQMAQQFMQRLSQIDPAVAPIVATAITDMLQDPSILGAAKDIQQAHEGFVHGRGIVTAQDRVADQLPLFKAVSLLVQNGDQKILKQVTDLLAPITPLVSKLRGNRTLYTDYNRTVQAYLHGWDIASVEYRGDGSAFYVLNNKSAINQQLMRQYFKTDLLAEGKNYMPDMSVTARRSGVTPLRVNETAAQFSEAISNLSRGSGVENNALRVAKGLPPITLRDFHLPSPDWANENAWFVKNSAGDVVGTISSGTEAQNKARATEWVTSLKNSTGEDHFAYALASVQRDHTFDDVFFNLENYSDQLAKTGAQMTGGLQPTTIDSTLTTLENTIKSLTKQYVNVGVRARASVFESQLNYARQASEIFGDNTMRETNVWQRYQAILFSRSTQSTKGLVGEGYSWAETHLDKLLSYMNGYKSEVTAQTQQGIENARAVRRLVGGTVAENELKQYQTAAKNWSPFEVTQQWLESTHPETGKVTSRQLMGTLSKATSTMALRFMDVGTPIMNLVGMIPTLPIVMRGMAKLPGESDIMHRARTASWASDVEFKPGLFSFSGTKATLNGIHGLWSKDMIEPTQEAVKMGIFEPEYSMLQHAMADPVKGDKTSWQRFVGAMSILADKSEAFSRRIAWTTGYRFARDVLKIDNEKARQITALHIMNETIGNYNPRNKPGIFQGAVGMPLGAMQTYMWNYYRRAFGYLERQDYRTLATQYALQTGVYGAQSVPGWSAFNSMLLSNYDGADTINNRLQQQLPKGVGELLLHGSLSSIPSIFGRHDLDIAFYPRGSLDITQIPANPIDWSRAPAATFLSNIAQGIQRTVSNVFGAGGFSWQEAVEAGANFSSNRAIKNIMEIVAGAKTDRAGAMVDPATRDWIHITSALAGTMPTATREIQDAYNSQQLVEKYQEYARSVLDLKTRAIIRSGDEINADKLMDIVSEYKRDGGNPAYFGQWLRNNFEAATVPKDIRKIRTLVNTQKFSELLNMLTALQTQQPTQGMFTNAR